MSPLSPTLYSSALSLVTAHHAQYDPSHDIHHVLRVHALALKLAQSDSSSPIPANLKVVSLAALFHDLIDSKYLPKDQPVPTAAVHLDTVFWRSHDLENEVTTEERELIARIVDHVSYSKEVKRIKAGTVTDWEKGCWELKCVQDADKLDAIGAFGIMRCAAYSAISNRPLYLPPSSSPETTNDSAIQHFHDKLFNLEEMMKTELGKKLARRRTEVMRDFVKSVDEDFAEASGDS